MKEEFYHLIDLSSVGLIVGALLGILPNLATIFTVAWLGMRLYNELMIAIYRARDRKRLIVLPYKTPDED